MVKALSLVACGVLALAALALVPSASAHPTGCAEYVLSYSYGVVCDGTYWCDNDGLCAQETCAAWAQGRNVGCVLSPPDALADGAAVLRGP